MPAPTALTDSLFLKACRSEAVPRPPVWLMRQAGRYMKEYRDIRARYSFLELCKTPDVAAHVTVDAAHRLGVDAAIIFSDLLVLLEPMGFHLSYEKDGGPAIANPFQSSADARRLRPVDVSVDMGYVMEAVRMARRDLKPDMPLLGFAGAPFTMAAYAIEGGGSRSFERTKRLMRTDPAAWNALLSHISDATVDYLNAQIAAGAQAVQLFDSWVGCLSPSDYERFVMPYTRRVFEGVRGAPTIHFGTQNAGLLELMKAAGGDVMGLDWRIGLGAARARLGAMPLMGNMDPQILLGSEADVRAEARRIRHETDGWRGFVFNLGHGILPGTPVENVFALVDEVRR